MATQKRAPCADRWFMTTVNTCKLEELEDEPHVNLAYDQGDPRHGTPEDPRIVLIGVDIASAVFFEMDKPQPVARSRTSGRCTASDSMRPALLK